MANNTRPLSHLSIQSNEDGPEHQLSGGTLLGQSNLLTPGGGSLNMELDSNSKESQ